MMLWLSVVGLLRRLPAINPVALMTPAGIRLGTPVVMTNSNTTHAAKPDIIDTIAPVEVVRFQ